MLHAVTFALIFDAFELVLLMRADSYRMVP
jgi:hypothetical protein